MRPDFGDAPYSLGVYEFYVSAILTALERYRAFLALRDSDTRLQQRIEHSKRRAGGGR